MSSGSQAWLWAAACIGAAAVAGCSPTGISSEELARIQAQAQRDALTNMSVNARPITAEQLDRLSRLGPEAQRTDVAAILGEPSWEGPNPKREELVAALGKEYVEQFIDARREEPGEPDPDYSMTYMLAPVAPNNDVRVLTVFLRSSRLTGYNVADASMVLPAERLAAVKPLLSGTTSARLRESLGPPNCTKSATLWSYTIAAPPELGKLDCENVTVGWRVATDGSARFDRHDLRVMSRSPDY